MITCAIYLIPLCIFYYFCGITWLQAIVLLLVAHLSWSTILGIRHDSLNRRQASERGALPIPRVRGKLPLNFDILLAWLYHSDEDVGRLFHDLSVRYGPTVNTRVLGEDQILSLDPDVFDAVMRDQFKFFAKG
jgi:hypothetical protein